MNTAVLLTCATLLISALPMPFPGRHHRRYSDLGCGHFRRSLSTLDQKRRVLSSETAYCTSELGRHIQVPHVDGSATPCVVVIEVRSIAYLCVA